jgi:hypothetical protein
MHALIGQVESPSKAQRPTLLEGACKRRGLSENCPLGRCFLPYFGLLNGQSGRLIALPNLWQ